ncbi:MAG: ABC transporter ATP-binding protein [Campylobacterales bacterium]
MTRVIEASDLHFAYDDENVVLKGGGFSLKAGEFLFVTGNSGSGKTTLIRSLYGAIKPQGGRLEVCGMEIRGITPSRLNKLRRHLGVVFQDYKLINEWTIEKNIMLPLLIAGYAKDVCDKQVTKLLNYVKLSHKVGKYPKELSGGEQQRVAVARAIAHNPVLLLADEPTGNLDEFSSHVVMEMFKMANKLGVAVVMATHKMPKLEIPFRHIHLEEGVIHEVS